MVARKTSELTLLAGHISRALQVPLLATGAASDAEKNVRAGLADILAGLNRTGIPLVARLPVLNVGKVVYLTHGYSAGARSDLTITPGFPAGGGDVGWNRGTRYGAAFGAADRDPGPLDYLLGTGAAGAYQVTALGSFNSGLLENAAQVFIDDAGHALNNRVVGRSGLDQYSIAAPPDLAGATFAFNLQLADGTFFYLDGDEVVEAGLYSWDPDSLGYVALDEIRDVTENHHPPTLNAHNYRALFVDYSLPRVWVGHRIPVAEVLAAGTFEDLVFPGYQGAQSSDPANPVAFHSYYSTSTHNWRQAHLITHFLGVDLRWETVSFHQIFGADYVWLGERESDVAAAAAIRGFDNTKTYLYYNPNAGKVESLDNSTYVAPMRSAFRYQTAVLGAGVPGSTQDRIELAHVTGIVATTQALAGFGARLRLVDDPPRVGSVPWYEVTLAQDIEAYSGAASLEVLLHDSVTDEWTELEVNLSDFVERMNRIALPRPDPDPAKLANTMSFKVGRLHTDTNFQNFGHATIYVGRSTGTNLLIQASHSICDELYIFLSPSGGGTTVVTTGDSTGQQSEGVAVLAPGLAQATVYQYLNAQPADPNFHWRFDSEWSALLGAWHTSRAVALESAMTNPAFDAATHGLWIATEQTRRRVVDGAYVYSDSGWTVRAEFGVGYSVDGLAWHVVQTAADNWIRVRSPDGSYAAWRITNDPATVPWVLLSSENTYVSSIGETHRRPVDIDLGPYGELMWTFQPFGTWSALGLPANLGARCEIVLQRPAGGWTLHHGDNDVVAPEGTYKVRISDTEGLDVVLVDTNVHSGLDADISGGGNLPFRRVSFFMKLIEADNAAADNQTMIAMRTFNWQSTYARCVRELHGRVG